MTSATAINRLSAPMTKRDVFTHITPLPLHVSRAAAVAFLHDYEAMIDVNPLVVDRVRIPPPPDAEPDEAACVWYQLTDAVAMPWSSSSSSSSAPSPSPSPSSPTPSPSPPPPPPPPSAPADSRRSTPPAKPKHGNVSYTCVFHRLPDGLQTHCRAPLGVDIRDRWTVGGTLPGEPRQPVELGLARLGAPAAGLYLREDVDLRCNRLMAGFVKKTLKKSHGALVEKITASLAAAEMPRLSVEQRPWRSSSSSSSSGGGGGGGGGSIPRPAACPPPPHGQPAYCAYRPPQAQQAQRETQQQQHHHQPSPSSSDAAAVLSQLAVPAALAIGRPQHSSHHQTAQLPPFRRSPDPVVSYEEAHGQRAPFAASFAAATSVASLSSAMSTVSLASSTSSAPSASAASLYSAASSLPTKAKTPPASSPAPPFTRFHMDVSPLTRLQLQLPHVAGQPPVFGGGGTDGAGGTDGGAGSTLATRQYRHSMLPQLPSPLGLGTSTGAAGEARRYSVGSSGHTALHPGVGIGGRSSRPGDFVSADPPAHAPALWPPPLRLGHQPSVPASGGQTPPTWPSLPPLAALVQTQLRPPAAAHGSHPDYPVMNPYADDSDTATTAATANNDDYEDDIIVSPILETDRIHERRLRFDSPTLFADLDYGSRGRDSLFGDTLRQRSVSPEAGREATPEVGRREAEFEPDPAADWQHWRRLL